MKNNSEYLLQTYLVTEEKLKHSTARDYASRTKTFLERNNLRLEELSWKELCQKIIEYLESDVETDTEYSVRSALRALIRFAKHISKWSKKIPHRDMIGFGSFMKSAYKKKRGNGPFLSTGHYESYLNTFCRLRRIPDWKLHQLSKAEMMSHILNLKDSKLQVSNVRHIISAAEAYYDYIRYTLGHYCANRD